MQLLAAICIKRPVFAWVLILIMAVIGVVGYRQLGVDRFPDVDLPTVVVTSISPGSSAQAVETDITNIIEDAVNTVGGIDEVTSTSSEGRSEITITFELTKDVNVASQEVREKVDTVIRDLPDDLDSPTVTTFDRAAVPVITLALSNSNPPTSSPVMQLRELTEFADKVLSKQIESTSGVGEVLILGGRARQINVLLDPYRLRSYHLTTRDVISALQAQNAEIPGGQVDQGARSLTLRTEGRLTKVADFERITLRSDKGGGIVRLSNVGRVEDGVEDAVTASELNGKTTVQIPIRKQTGANSLAIINAIKVRLKEIQKTLPEGYTLKIVRDESSFIEASVSAVQEHLIVGSILATVVVFVFLASWRGTIIAAVSIPTSIIATYGGMWLMGFTLNIITLLAVTLSVGIVIDDAIVVLENIQRFIDEKKMAPYQAAIAATQDIGLAVLATTLSLIAIFVPVAFMSGIVGRFFNSFALTMAIAIAISLLVAFILTPMLSSRMLKPSRNAGKDTSKGGGGFFGVIERFYTVLLKWSMGHRWAIVLLCFAALGTIPFTISRVPTAFLPLDDESQLEISFTAPEGTSLDTTTEIARQMCLEVRAQPGVEFALLTAGSNNNLNEGSILVRLKPVGERSFSQSQFVTTLRERVIPHFQSANLRTIVTGAAGFGGTGRDNAPIQYVLRGPDLEKLTVAANKVLEGYRKVPGVVDADTSLNDGKPEIQVVVNRDVASQLGVSPADVATALRYFVGGDQVTDFNEKGEQYEVHVRAQEPFRTGTPAIGILTVPSTLVNTGAPTEPGTLAGAMAMGAPLGSVPLQQVVKFEAGTGPAAIKHYGGQPRVTISSDVLTGTSQTTVIAALEKLVADQHLGVEYLASTSGTSREQGRALSSFFLALGIAFILMYLILAAQFESWIYPITILMSLPLTLPFVIVSLVLFHQTLNIFSLLGILVLFGVVQKNAILQIDHTQHMRSEGLNRLDAIIQANRDRLRPILMTTTAFVAGMIPLLISSGVGAGTNRAIGAVIAGGQSMSLLLTLLATPVIYSLLDDASVWAGATVARVSARFGKKGSSTKAAKVTP